MHALLNELSLRQYADGEKSKAALDRFASTIRACNVFGVIGIALPRNFLEHTFSPSYTFSSWIRDHKDIDFQTLMRSIMGTFPDIETLWDRCQDEHSIISAAVSSKECVAFGIGASQILNRICFSFGDSEFEDQSYSVVINVLTEEDDDLQEVHFESTVRNASHASQVAFHRSFLEEYAERNFLTGRELWLRRSALFPNLEFCPQVEKQVSNLFPSNPEFEAIVNRLFELQIVASRCDGRTLAPSDYLSVTSPESTTRLNKFSNELTIVCPDSTSRLFSWHCRFTPGAGRIHFIPYEAEKRILVGSIANQNKIK